MKHIIAALLLTLPLTAVGADWNCRGQSESDKIKIGVWDMPDLDSVGIWEGNRDNMMPAWRMPSGTRNQKRWTTTWGENFVVLTVNEGDQKMHLIWSEPHLTDTFNGTCKPGQ